MMEPVDVETGNPDQYVGRQELILKFKEDLKGQESIADNESRRPSIYMVPKTIRNLKQDAYSPRVISIGPFHKDNPELKPMNGYKHRFMHRLFRRTSESTMSSTYLQVESCLDAICSKTDQIKAHYSLKHTNIEWGKDFSDMQLAEMMVLDGCFILELLDDNPVIDNLRLTLDIIHDLVLLENQIPFVVLKAIFECTVGKINPTATLTKLVLSFFKATSPFHKKLAIDNDIADAHHILGLLQKAYQPSNGKPSEFSMPASHSASDLDRAGVDFKPHKDAKWQLHMEFKPSSWRLWSWGSPTFEMPILHIQDSTESFLRNLIAYELCTPLDSNHVSSYLLLMDKLIDTKEDVDKLVESSVILNDLGSNDDAATMINQICKEVVINKFYFYEQLEELDNYYNGYWPKHIAWLRRTYFSNPWSSIALVAAIVLFGLSVVQTYFTIRPLR